MRSGVSKLYLRGPNSKYFRLVGNTILQLWKATTDKTNEWVQI